MVRQQPRLESSDCGLILFQSSAIVLDGTERKFKRDNSTNDSSPISDRRTPVAEQKVDGDHKAIPLTGS